MENKDTGHTYLTIQDLALKSGIFKTELVNGALVPHGIYKLFGKKQLSEENTIPDVKHRALLWELTQILTSWFRAQEKYSRNIEEEIEDILRALDSNLKNVFETHGFPDEEAKPYINKAIKSRNFKKELKRKLKGINMKPFEETKGDKKFYDLRLPLFRLLQEYLKTNAENTYYYMAYFLVGCGIESGNIDEVKNRIKQFVNRRKVALRGL